MFLNIKFTQLFSSHYVFEYKIYTVFEQTHRHVHTKMQQAKISSHLMKQNYKHTFQWIFFSAKE